MTDREALEGFENGTFPKDQWNHAAHLRVVGCYLVALPRAEALDRMRRGVSKYNEAVGGKNTEDSGYHETLTCFWVEVAGAFLDGSQGSESEKIQALVDEFGPQRDLFQQYYSFDVVKSREARRVWIPPDLKPLP
jgi:hypothetical protein